eukprot:508309_1
MSILDANETYEPKLQDRIRVKTAQGRLQGIIRYIGTVNNSKSIRYGIELIKAMGNHDGTYKGHQYFKCKKNHGIIVKRSSILKKLKFSQPSQRKLKNIVQKPLKIPNKTFDRIKKIIYNLLRNAISSNSVLVDPNIILLIYIYCDPYQFKFVKQCTKNTIGEISIHQDGLTLSNLNDNGGFGIVLLGDNGLFPFSEWNLVDIKDGNVMEYKYSFIIHRLNTQNGNIYISNGFFGIVIVSANFYHFCSLKGINDKKKKKNNKGVMSKVYHIIHDMGFKTNCLNIPPKYYGEYKPINCGFDFPYKRPTVVKIQCKKCVRKGIKERIEWDSKIIIEVGSNDNNNRHEFQQYIGNTENIGKFRIGLLLYAPDAECSNTWLFRCKASIESQEVTQLSNVDF